MHSSTSFASKNHKNQPVSLTVCTCPALKGPISKKENKELKRNVQRIIKLMKTLRCKLQKQLNILYIYGD